MRSVEERFWAKVKKTDGCWLWTGATGQKPDRAYGQIWQDGRQRKATHVSWELHHGKPVPPGAHVLHTCDIPRCVRPDHLYLGDPKANAQDRSRRGRHHMQRRTHCPHGHPYSGDNLYFTYEGYRACCICRARHLAKYQSRVQALQEKES